MKKIILFALMALISTSCSSIKDRRYRKNLTDQRALLTTILQLNGVDALAKIEESPHVTMLDDITVHDINGNIEALDLSDMGISIIPKEISLFIDPCINSSTFYCLS